MSERKGGAGRVGGKTRSLLDALEQAQLTAKASTSQPFSLADFAQSGNRAAQNFANGLTDFVGDEGKRLINNRMGLRDIAQGARKQTSLEDALNAFATGPARLGRGFTRPDLASQREGLGQMASGALDASMLMPAVGAAGKGVRKAFGAIPVPDRSAMVGAGIPFSGKPGEKPLLNALLDRMRGGKDAPVPDSPPNFTPPRSIDDIGAGYDPAGPRPLTGGHYSPTQMEGGAFNGPQAAPAAAVPYDPASGGFQGIDAGNGAAARNKQTLLEALAKAKGRDSTLGAGVPFGDNPKPLGYDDWSPEWRAAHDKGLPMDQASRMQRAREQGFNVDETLYHGTASDFDAMKPSADGAYGPGVYLTDNPRRASDFAVTADARGASGNVGPNILPVFATDVRKNDFAHLVDDPANIRSVNAAFDPANIGKPSLLGAGSAAFDSAMNSDLMKLLLAYGAASGMTASGMAMQGAMKPQGGM